MVLSSVLVRLAAVLATLSLAAILHGEYETYILGLKEIKLDCRCKKCEKTYRINDCLETSNGIKIAN